MRSPPEDIILTIARHTLSRDVLPPTLEEACWTPSREKQYRHVSSRQDPTPSQALEEDVLASRAGELARECHHYSWRSGASGKAQGRDEKESWEGLKAGPTLSPY